MKLTLFSIFLTLPLALADDVVVSFWIKSFIPLSVPDVTETYPQDSSKSMIRGIPIIGDCFLTDHRTFSSAVGASSRTHSQAWIWIKPDGASWSQEHHCDETVEVDCEDGDVEGTETQNADGMKFTQKSASSSKVVLEYEAAASNPLVSLAPDIDLKGTLTVDRVNGFVEFVGMVDDFPAFEAYVSVNGSDAQMIDTLGPEEGAGPGSLVGGAGREFRGRVEF